MTTEEKLIEDAAKTIYADWGFGEWDKLMEAEKDTWRKTANQIHELYKKYTWLKGDEEPYKSIQEWK